MKYDKNIVQDHWSETDYSMSEDNFYCFPAIRSRSCQLIFGETDATDKAWCEYYTITKHLQSHIPFEKCLSICCGFGAVERTLSKLNVAKKIIGVDIAPGAIDVAKKRAELAKFTNIDYYVADLNQETLPYKEYDLIWANGALHHISDLERVISGLFESMKNGGYLVSVEYVGPNYYQTGIRQQEIINAVKHLLPPELRGKPSLRKPYGKSIPVKVVRRVRQLLGRKAFGKIYEILWENSSVKDFLNSDPSEGVNSSNIIPTLKKYFDDVEVRYFNGSILMHALDSKFYDNFNPNNMNHVAILQMLFNIEDTLASSGEISQDNAHIICRKH